MFRGQLGRDMKISIVLLSLLFFVGCDKGPPKHYNVIASDGSKYFNLTIEDSGWGWVSFKTQDGRTLTLIKPSVIEEIM